MSFLISFEGIDGCGKTTQIDLLVDKLRSKNMNCMVLREPGDTSISNKIREILLDKNNEICPESETLLFLSARSQLVREKIIPNIKKGNIVICDRYLDSTLAYQGYGRGLDKNMINNLNLFATNKMLPGLTFILDIDPKIAYDRIIKKDIDRMESEGVDFLNNISNGYKIIAKSNPRRCKVIMCRDKDKHVIHEEILNIVNDYIEEEYL
jgi:dTMP kinase